MPDSVFAPIGYRLNLGRIWSAPIKRLANGGQAVESTVGEFVEEARGLEILNVTTPGLMADRLRLATATVELEIEATPFVVEVLEATYKLMQRGIGGKFDCVWFWFDQDEVTDDPMRSFSFFVVSGDKILEDYFTFADGDGFDPAVFEPAFAELAGTDKSPIWRSTVPNQEATVAYWYRKFYAETKIGQLMTLRPDRPKLFYYEDVGANVQASLTALREELRTVQNHLKWLIVLVGGGLLTLFLRGWRN